MGNSAEGIRGVRPLQQEGNELTTAEETWVQTEAALGNIQVDTFTASGSASFTLSQTYSSYIIGSEGGRVVSEGSGKDFTASGTTLTFTYTPPIGSEVIFVYRY